MNFTETRGLGGQIVGQSSPLSSQKFAFDQDGRLVTVQDTVSSGQSTSCTTRQYAFDQNSNRTSLKSFGADGTGACSTATTPSTVSSTYDQADRITNPGYAYDTLGRTTLVPAVDANGVGQYAADTGNLTVGYYANDMVHTESQGAGSITYTLDPQQERIASIDNGSSVTINHYADSSDSPAWSSTNSSTWTRSLDGIDGGFAVKVDQTGAATVELANMHGDDVATAFDDPNATGIQGGSYSETTEYGVARTPATATTDYGWLGSKKRSGDSLGGLSLMGVRLYDSATGRFLSIDSVPGGNDNAYVYPLDPISSSDVSGKWSRGDTWNAVFIGLTVLDFVPGVDCISGPLEFGPAAYRAATTARRVYRAAQLLEKGGAVAGKMGRLGMRGGRWATRRGGLRWVGRDAVKSRTRDGGWMYKSGARSFRTAVVKKGGWSRSAFEYERAGGGSP